MSVYVEDDVQSTEDLGEVWMRFPRKVSYACRWMRWKQKWQSFWVGDDISGARGSTVMNGVKFENGIEVKPERKKTPARTSKSEMVAA